MDTTVVWFLSAVVFLPAIGALVLALPIFSRDSEGLTKGFSLGVTVVTFFMTLSLIVGHWFGVDFEAGQAEMQNLFALSWIPSFNIYYMLGIDGISFPLVILTSFISMMAMAASWNITKHVQAPTASCFCCWKPACWVCFFALDFFLFYVFWEVMLLPMYFLIGVWGGPRKEYAAIKFFLYTLVGSVLMLIAILMLYFNSDLRQLTDAVSTEQLAQAGVISNTLDSENYDSLEAQQTAEIAAIRDSQDPLHTFNILALQLMGQHTGLFGDPADPENPNNNILWGQIASVVGVRAAVDWLCHQGAQRAGAYLAARCPRRSPHADLDDPGRRAAEDGRLRHHPYLLPDLSRRRLRTGLVRLRLRRREHGLWSLRGAGPKDFKRLVAYSSVSHMGYVVLGLGVWSATGRLTNTIRNTGSSA